MKDIAEFNYVQEGESRIQSHRRAFHRRFLLGSSSMRHKDEEKLAQMPRKKTKYDWKIPGFSLKPVGSDNPRHEIVLVRVETLSELYEGGFLTGQALKDVEDL